MNALASSKRRLTCPACKRTVERHSRQQQYCSTRCRMKAFREKMPEMGACSGSVTNPPKISHENNVLQWPKTGSGLSANGPINLLGGGSWRWPDAGRIDSATLAKVRWCEVGGDLVQAPEPK
jgi:endogenous inhibitor of DNA gyrase (YacG/DUF329 family)